ncbi:Uncharacterized protein, chloroplastic [Vitis vinifera]|uniref:Uncharacterized protein, chloroplastic n=1 Tax=Vitis vinifera TaxID=29760 RepID=A0A438HRP7_VITVI|nr:Uncharacterized protein, chloroplastic [Vitis vinifera]
MGHNRGWEEAASMFSGASIELKTCNAALLEATGKSWEEGLFGREFASSVSIHDTETMKPGGRCWFGVEKKTFEIIIEEQKGRVRGKICERGPKSSSWIRFGGKSLSLLLEGVETCCGLQERTPFKKFWSEGDRNYSLELRSNKAGRFLFCVVRDVENKRFSLAFPEGGDLVGGWNLLVSKLKSLGVSPFQWKGALPQALPNRGVDKVSIPLRVCPAPRDAVWLEADKESLVRNEEMLDRCLIGLWKGDSDRLPDPVSFGAWAKNTWLLEGNLWLSNMRENLLFLEFEFADEAERVLNLGEKSFRGRSFHLEKWKPSVGCLKEDNGDSRLVWVKILGLPLHLWGRNLFKRFGDSCGRFVAVDENTAERRNLKWARILIETRDWHHPRARCLEAQGRRRSHSRAEGSVGFPPSSSALSQPEKPPPQPEKLPPQPVKLSPPALGRDEASDKSMSTVHQALACDLDLGLGMDSSAHPNLACPIGPGLGKAQPLENTYIPPGPVSSSDLGLGTPSRSPRRWRGLSAESPQLEAPSHLEVTSANDLPLTAEGRNLQGMLLPPPPPLNGMPSSPSSTPFLVTGSERERGCSGQLDPTSRETDETPIPLSLMLRDGSTVVLRPDFAAKQKDHTDISPREEVWSEEEISNLFHFSKVLGMPVEGHEVEILNLLEKLKLRTGNSTLCKRRKKKKILHHPFRKRVKKVGMLC